MIAEVALLVGQILIVGAAAAGLLILVEGPLRKRDRENGGTWERAEKPHNCDLPPLTTMHRRDELFGGERRRDPEPGDEWTCGVCGETYEVIEVEVYPPSYAGKRGPGHGAKTTSYSRIRSPQ